MLKTNEELKKEVLDCLNLILDCNEGICKEVGKKNRNLRELVMSMQTEIDQLKEEIDTLKRRLNNSPVLQ